MSFLHSKEKRIQEFASQVSCESLQGQLRQAVIDLDHVEAALKLFDPEVDLSALPARKIAPVSYDTKGDTGRIILETLRNATKPLSTAQIAEAVMVARRLDFRRQDPVPGDDAPDQRQP